MSVYKPHIIWDPTAYDLFWDYVDLCPGEVAVWGYVEIEGLDLYVSEIFLVPQEANAAGVDFVTNGLPYAIEKAIADDKLDQLRFCAHSHGTFGAHWSKTDETMIASLGASGTPWLVSCIFNKKGDTTGRIDMFNDSPWGKLQATMKDLSIHRERTNEAEDQMISDLEHFVKDPPKQEKKASSPAPRSKTPVTGLSKAFLETLGTLSFDEVMHLTILNGWDHVDDSTGARHIWDPSNGDFIGSWSIPPDWEGEPFVEGDAEEIEASLAEAASEDERELGVTANS